MKPKVSILSWRFRYVKAEDTNIRKTFDRIKMEQRIEAYAKERPALDEYLSETPRQRFLQIVGKDKDA